MECVSSWIWQIMSKSKIVQFVIYVFDQILNVVSVRTCQSIEFVIPGILQTREFYQIT